MFVQIIKGHVTDADRFRTESRRWGQDLKPGATGYLGATWGVTADGTGFLAARFESEAAAKANSERPEQGEWWSRIEPAFADVSFVDCREVDTMLGGGSDAAGFVQVIQGRVKDQADVRSTLPDVESQLAENRKDLLGGVMAWHGDDGAFTQIVYFTSEADARSGEGAIADQDLARQFEEMMAVPPAFLDLGDPQFD